MIIGCRIAFYKKLNNLILTHPIPQDKLILTWNSGQIQNSSKHILDHLDHTTNLHNDTIVHLDSPKLDRERAASNLTSPWKDTKDHEANSTQKDEYRIPYCLQ